MHPEILKKIQHYFILLIFSFFLLWANLAHALPFNIIPKPGTTLPTTINVSTSTSVPAFYTVFNNTISQRNNNFVKYLPPNVRQITTGGVFPDTCGVLFNLAPKGAPGSSCTLQLEVFGAVNASDPNPHDHLFVCFPGGITCAGTNNPLNVSLVTLSSISIVPALATINTTHTLQYVAMATYSNGSTADVSTAVTWRSSNTTVATISATGLATGHTIGSTNITALFQGILSNQAILNVINPLVSITVAPASASIHAGGTQPFTATGHFADGTTANITTSVNWTSSNATVATIDTSGLATGHAAGSSQITARSGNITSNIAMLNVDNPLVSIAVTPTTATISAHGTQQFTATGTFSDGSHQDITTTAMWNSSVPSVASISATGLATAVSVGSTNITATLNAIPSNTAVLTVNSFLYVVNLDTSISYCNVNAAGSIVGCLHNTTIANPKDITVSPKGKFAYVVQSSPSNGLFLCGLNTNDGNFSSCAPTADIPFNTPGQIAITTANTFAYIPEVGAVVRCEVNATTGVLSMCSTTGDITFFTPLAIAVNPAGTFAYITDGTTGVVTVCGIAGNGALSGCHAASPTTFANPTAITINPAGTVAYVTEAGSFNVQNCQLNPNGTFGLCVPQLGTTFSAPSGITIDSAGINAYITNATSGFIDICQFTGGGILINCSVPPQVFTNPFGISIN